jgi:hypothetical protein
MAKRRPVNKGQDLDRPLRGLPRQGTMNVSVKLDKDELSQIDAFIASSGPPYVSRPEAIRRLIQSSLRVTN